MTLECLVHGVYTLEAMVSSGQWGGGKGASIKGTKLGMRPI